MNVLSFIFISKHRCSLAPLAWTLRVPAPFGRSLRWGRGLWLRLNFFQFLVDFPEKIVLFCEFLFDKFVFLPKIDKRFIKKFNVVFFRFRLFDFFHFGIGNNKFLVGGCWGFIFAPAGRFAGDGAGGNA